MHNCFFGFFLSFLIVAGFGNAFIRVLQKWQIGQVIRKLGPQSHYGKKGTPTMGGLLLIVAILVSSAIFADYKNPLVYMSLVTLASFSAIGFYDDYKKLILKDSHGLSARWKYFWQSLFAILLALWFHHLFIQNGMALRLQIPFAAHFVFVVSPVIFMTLLYFTVTGASNAVNLTDGLDGLAILSIFVVAIGLFILIQLQHDVNPLAQALLPVLAALLGASLGFWWLNGFPALLFMGDVGALGIGALLAFIAIAIQSEFFLALMGGIFIAETLSVILQVGSFRLRNKKRIFKMAPLHHHFELTGIPEPRVVARFTIITILLVVLALWGSA